MYRKDASRTRMTLVGRVWRTRMIFSHNGRCLKSKATLESVSEVVCSNTWIGLRWRMTEKNWLRVEDWIKNIGVVRQGSCDSGSRSTLAISYALFYIAKKLKSFDVLRKFQATYDGRGWAMPILRTNSHNGSWSGGVLFTRAVITFRFREDDMPVGKNRTWDDRQTGYVTCLAVCLPVTKVGTLSSQNERWLRVMFDVWTSKTTLKSGFTGASNSKTVQ